MQECAYRPNALLARIGRTPGTTTTVCSVHGARFSSHAPLSPPRARDRFERSTAITARRLPSPQQHHLPHPRQPFPVAGAALVISSRPTSISGVVLPTTPRARLSASAPRTAACAPLTAAISHRARRIQARREHPQRYTTPSLEASPAARRKNKEQHQRPAQRPQRRLPIPHAAFFASRAPPSSAAPTLRLF
ncbi:hypothetical protein B0H14DRAFT_2997506, partial [Mycena olivaceomarginata]